MKKKLVMGSSDIVPPRKGTTAWYQDEIKKLNQRLSDKQDELTKANLSNLAKQNMIDSLNWKNVEKQGKIDSLHSTIMALEESENLRIERVNNLILQVRALFCISLCLFIALIIAIIYFAL